jgi:hypothetical protein
MLAVQSFELGLRREQLVEFGKSHRVPHQLARQWITDDNHQVRCFVSVFLRQLKAAIFSVDHTSDIRHIYEYVK